MTVQLPIERTLSDVHREATDDVNRWRGHCIESYARLEHAVTITLSTMAAIPEANLSVPHNFGDKINKLREAVELGQRFENSRLAKSLDCFAEHLGRRNMLVHSTGKVTIDAKGRWVWGYTFLSSGKAGSVENGSFEQDEALKIGKSLASDVQRLRSHMDNLRKQAVTE
jgi:hypothetical protein